MSGDWDERLGWTWDLISDDPARRELAHGVLDQARLDNHEAWRRSNTVWNQPGNELLHDQYRWTRSRLLPEAIWVSRLPDDENLGTWEGLPYLLLYLRWEASFPDEWTWHAKRWSSKTSMLRLLTRNANRLPEHVLQLLSDLVAQVAARPQRLGDEWYARLARALPQEPLYSKLLDLHSHGDATARERAGYLLWLLDDPKLPQPKFAQWQGYLSERHGRGQHSRVRGRTTARRHNRQDVILIRCPRCAAQGTVRRVVPQLAGEASTWHAACSNCGYTEHRSRRATLGSVDAVAREHIFGHPLWLQARCCGDNLLAADHLEDLDRQESYLRARVCLDRSNVGYGQVPGDTRLPYWMMTAGNRAELLAVIAHLRTTVT